MILQSNIGWCDDTTNAVTGCDKVSEGCKNCYAQMGTRARVLRAMGIETWGAGGVRHPVMEFAKKLRRLNKLCICDKCHEAHEIDRLHQECGLTPGTCGATCRRIRLFADSNSDWLDEKWPIETLAAFLKEIHDAPNVDVLLLTKRSEKFEGRMQKVLEMVNMEQPKTNAGYKFFSWLWDWLHGKAPNWVWIGVSVENQKMADLRIPQLLGISAAVRFLSCEPLLASVTLDPFLKPEPPKGGTPNKGQADAIGWVIVGGESGKNRRAVEVGAITNIAEQCLAAGVPVYVKQDVAFKSGKQGRISDEVWKLKQFPKLQNIQPRTSNNQQPMNETAPKGARASGGLTA